MKNKIILIILGIAVSSCSPKIKSSLADQTFQPIDSHSEVLILNENDVIPESSKFVGDLKIGDNGFSKDCGYERVINDARTTARSSGANIVHILSAKEPDLASTCYRIKAKLYRNIDQEKLATIIADREKRNKSRLPEGTNYAMVYFYRPSSFTGAAIGYNIRLDDKTEIGRVPNGKKFSYKTTNLGEHTFWAKTESSDSIKLNLEAGKEYFIKCGINMGIAVGRPKLALTENHIGIKEYDAVIKESK